MITWPVAIALLAVYVFWGGTYLAMKIASETMPPFLMAGVRFILAGGLLYGWQVLRGEARPQPIHWRNAAVVGGIMLLGGNGSIVWAEQYVASGMAAIIFASVPFWVTLFSWLWQGNKRPGGMVFAGIALGLAGIGLLVRNSVSDLSNGTVYWGGYAALGAASLFWSAGTLYSRVAKLPEATFMSIAIQMLTGGVFCLLFGLITGEVQQVNLDLLSERSLLALGYLIIFGSLIGFSAYIWLVKVADPTLVTTNTYVNPVIAVLLGWLLAGERMTPQDVLAAAIVMLAVIIITKANQHKTKVVEVRAVGLPESD